MVKYYWLVYKKFYDPPGTPQDLRCIGCRYTVAAGGAGVGLLGAYGMKKTMWNNVFRGMSCFGVALVGFATMFIGLKMAATDKHWNETRYLELQAETKAKRQQYKESMQMTA